MTPADWGVVEEVGGWWGRGAVARVRDEADHAEHH